jgi:thymine-DNA glycosylase
MAAGVPTLVLKVSRYRPRIVCFVGRGIWTNVEKVLSIQTAANPQMQAPSKPSRVVLAAPRKPRQLGKKAGSIWRYGLQPYIYYHDDNATDATSSMSFSSESTLGIRLYVNKAEYSQHYSSLRQAHLAG